jgi:hypothetical protein
MDKKLSSLFIEKKVRLIASGTPEIGQYMHQSDVKIYGEIIILEERFSFYPYGSFLYDRTGKKLNLIAQEHGITEYKL